MPQPAPAHFSAQPDRRFITALARGLDLLSCFRSGEKLLGNQELAQRCQLPKSTISRLTHTLTQLGYLHYVPEASKYRLGSACLSLGSAMLCGLYVRQHARPLMQRLAMFTQTEVALATRDRHMMVYIEHCPSPHAQNRARTTSLDLGIRLPLATTAIGRAWLAACSQEERDEALSHIKRHAPEQWQTIEPQPANDPHAQPLVCSSFGDWQPHVNAIALGFAPGRGLPVMALSCGGSSPSVAPSFLQERVQPELIRTVQRLQQLLKSS